MIKMKKKFYTLLLTTFLITGTCAVCAENISFNVTVGGSGAQDPLSKRKEKRDYNTTAPGGEYYFMKATTGGPRINVKGDYCP